MSIHYFHCSDGADALIDRRGRGSGSEDLQRCAIKVARQWMGRLPGFEDWSAWAVYVHDEDGRCVATVPFPEIGVLEAERLPRGRRRTASVWPMQQDQPAPPNA